MILSPASDLATRQTVWAGRKTDDAPQTMGQELPITIESVWYAGAAAITWQDEALARLPQWDD